MKYTVNYYKNENEAPKYVSTVDDYQRGGMCDPIMMEKEEAEDLLGRLNKYVAQEYIGANDDDNRRAHDAFEDGQWGFAIEEWSMPGDEVDTLEELADYYNDSDDYPLDLEDIIERNGWVSDCHTEWGICHTDTEKVVVNDEGKAVVVSY